MTCFVGTSDSIRMSKSSDNWLIMSMFHCLNCKIIRTAGVLTIEYWRRENFFLVGRRENLKEIKPNFFFKNLGFFFEDIIYKKKTYKYLLVITEYLHIRIYPLRTSPYLLYCVTSRFPYYVTSLFKHFLILNKVFHSNRDNINTYLYVNKEVTRL